MEDWTSLEEVAVKVGQKVVCRRDISMGFYTIPKDTEGKVVGIAPQAQRIDIILHWVHAVHHGKYIPDVMTIMHQGLYGSVVQELEGHSSFFLIC